MSSTAIRRKNALRASLREGAKEMDFSALLSAGGKTSFDQSLLEIPSQVVMLQIEDILDDVTFQYRLNTGDVTALAEDLRVRGQTTPVFVRAHRQKYQLISGFRRVTALRTLEQGKVLARLFQNLSDAQAMGLAISENLQRQDFSDLEIALVCQRLRKAGRSTEAIASAIGRAQRTVQAYLAAFGAPAPVRSALHEGKISLSGAVDLSKKGIPERVILEILQKCEEDRLSVREVRQLLRAKERSLGAGLSSAGSRTRSAFQPVRLVDRDTHGFDLLVKFRPHRQADRETIIQMLRSLLKRLERAS